MNGNAHASEDCDPLVPRRLVHCETIDLLTLLTLATYAKHIKAPWEDRYNELVQARLGHDCVNCSVARARLDAERERAITNGA